MLSLRYRCATYTHDQAGLCTNPPLSRAMYTSEFTCDYLVFRALRQSAVIPYDMIVNDIVVSMFIDKRGKLYVCSQGVCRRSGVLRRYHHGQRGPVRAGRSAPACPPTLIYASACDNRTNRRCIGEAGHVARNTALEYRPTETVHFVVQRLGDWGAPVWTHEVMMNENRLHRSSTTQETVA